MASNAPLFARQPIFDRQQQVVAYELLFRHSDENYSEFVDGDQATSHVLLNTFGGRQLESVIGKHKAYINYTRNLLISPPDLPREKVVIEVLENIIADDEVIEGLIQLQQSGYEIALDDYFINRETKKLLHFANIIKIDVLSSSEAQLIKYIAALKPLKLILLAEKIEDYEMLKHCKELGFDLFQGYFLCKPEIIRGAKVSANRTAIIRLISILNAENSTHSEIVAAVSSDAGLSYKILKLVNSAAIGLSRQIESLSQSISLLGLNKIRNWATFILMASNQNKPEELSIISLCRAKFCEHMGQHVKDKNFAQTCFTVGILSNLDSFLDMPMYELRNELSLAKNIEDALIEGTGVEGLLLETARAFERGDWSMINWPALENQKIFAENLNDWYTESISGAIKLVQETTHPDDRTA